jgi:hypothetical protein
MNQFIFCEKRVEEIELESENWEGVGFCNML